MQFWASEFENDLKVFACIQRWETKLVKVLEDVSCEEWLRSLGLPNLKKRRLRADLTVFYSFLRRGNEERDANLFSLKSSDKMHKKVWFKAVPGEVHTGHKEALREGGQTFQTS